MTGRGGEKDELVQINIEGFPDKNVVFEVGEAVVVGNHIVDGVENEEDTSEASPFCLPDFKEGNDGHEEHADEHNFCKTKVGLGNPAEIGVEGIKLAREDGEADETDNGDGSS